MRQTCATRFILCSVGFSLAVIAAACSGSSGTPAQAPSPANVVEFSVTTDASQPSRPLSLAVGPDRNIWFTEFEAKSIGLLDLASNSVSHYPIPSSGSNPTHITMGPDGQLWFTETGPADSDPADTGINNLGQISATGEIKEIPLPVTDSDPTGMTLGPDGNVWFTEAATGDARRSTAEGVISDPIAASAANSMPGGMTNGPDGNLWFTENATGIVDRLTPDGVLNSFPLSNAGSAPTELAVGADGNLWFAEGAADKIGRITPDGTVSEFVTPTSNSVPGGVALGPDCDIWFTETNANQIGRIDSSGHITEFTLPTPNSQPAGIILGPDGNLWFAESAANKIAKLIPPPGSPTSCAAVTLPPVAKCQDAKVNTDAGACTASSASIDNGSFDPQNISFTESTSPAGPYNLGQTAATLTVRRSPTVAAACAAQVEVDDVEPPTLTCPSAVSTQCTSAAGAIVSLTPTATDNCPNLGTPTCQGSGSSFPLGSTSVTCSVSDSSHNTSSCITTVTVVDTTPPVITALSAAPSVLWAPDHKLVPVTVSVSATDTCDPSAASRCSIVGVSANQRISPRDFKVTGPLTVMLSAEREGHGSRAYSIQVKCSDASGNSAIGVVTVAVPHDQGERDDDDHEHHGDSGQRR